MAKCYKVTMYVLNLNDFPSSKTELLQELECIKYPEYKGLKK